MSMTKRSGTNGSMQPCPKPNPVWKPEAHRAGGFIPQEFCRSRWVTRRKATLCSMKPFGKFLRSARVGDQAPDSVEGTYPRNAPAAQFAEVCNHVHFSRGPDHHIIQLGFEHIRRRGAVREIETVDRKEKTVRVKLVHHRFCLRSHE